MNPADLTDEEIRDLVRDCDLDWHKGWSVGPENSYATFAHAVAAHVTRMRPMEEAPMENGASILAVHRDYPSCPQVVSRTHIYDGHDPWCNADSSVSGEDDCWLGWWPLPERP
jgi:hypothetical protein